jgi:putative tryptophan/tyrosine transport system substrate-binding protein
MRLLAGIGRRAPPYGQMACSDMIQSKDSKDGSLPAKGQSRGFGWVFLLLLVAASAFGLYRVVTRSGEALRAQETSVHESATFFNVQGSRFTVPEGSPLRTKLEIAPVDQVAVIVTAGSTPATLAAKAATQTIPILFGIASDPVALGLVRSLNRPGGNLTGVTSLIVELRGKQLELLRKLVPTADLIAALVNPANPNSEVETKELLAAARVLGVRMLILNASRQGDIEAAFATLEREQARGVVINRDAFIFANPDQVVALAARYAIPAIYASRVFAEAGGLLAYGANTQEDGYRLGNYSGRILRGEKAADLPVYQATKFELVINLKTAKALGLTVPPTMLAVADEVIE